MSMRYKWDNDRIVNLIELYRANECLWNHTDDKYKCREARNDAWNMLSAATGTDPCEAKRKMKNLIAQFYRERKKYRSLNPAVGGTSTTPKWFAYNSLLFLRNNNKVRQCSDEGWDDVDEKSSEISEIDNEDFLIVEETADITNETTSQEDGDESLEEMPVCYSTHPSRPSKINLQHLQNATNNSNRNEKMKALRSVKSERVLKRKADDDEGVEVTYELMKQLYNSKQRDSYSIFGEHVACKIRNLRKECARNTVEHLISTILWEASMGKYDHPPPSLCSDFQPQVPMKLTIN